MLDIVLADMTVEYCNYLERRRKMDEQQNYNNRNEDDPSALWTRDDGNHSDRGSESANGENRNDGNPYAQNQNTGNPYAQNQNAGNPYAQNRNTGNSYTQNQNMGNPYAQNQNTGNSYGQPSYPQNYGNGSSYNNGSDGKKGGFGKTLLKIAALAAVVGVVGGGTFYGINKLSTYLAQNIAAEDTVDSSGKIATRDESVSEKESDKAETILPGTGKTIETTSVLSEEDSDITDLSGIVDDVMPSIVAVNSTVTYTDNYYGYYFGEEKQAESSGSGVIYGEDGENLYIVSNHHVIEDAVEVKVTFIDETTADAKVKGSDSDVDLAVLEVKLKDLSEETKKAIKLVSIGSSDELEVGEMVIAIGNALGYGQSMTAGYISAKEREVTISDTGVTMTLLQTDAAINPGNSGGALLNMKGELVGITNVKYAQTTVEGMGFAIPISDATEIIGELESIVELKDEERGYLGISCENITQKQNSVYNIPVGVYVTEVAKQGAAYRAGIMAGDIITKVNGTRVETRSSLQGRITNKKVGTVVKITFQRSESGEYKEHEVEVTLQGQESLGSMAGNESSGNNKKNEQPESGNSPYEEEQSPYKNSPYGDYYNDDDFLDRFFEYYYNR